MGNLTLVRHGQASFFGADYDQLSAAGISQSRALGDLNFYVPAGTYGIVECAHQVLLHAWLDRFLGIEEWNRDGANKTVPSPPAR